MAAILSHLAFGACVLTLVACVRAGFEPDPEDSAISGAETGLLEAGRTGTPISASDLGDELAKTQVPCIETDGTVNPSISSIPIVDSSTVKLVDGKVTLVDAPAETRAWIGSLTSVTVIYDPNACGDEAPNSSATDWASAGLLVRGAYLDPSGRIVCGPQTTTSDVDFIDVVSSGAFDDKIQSEDFFGADDAKLAAYPNLVQPINAAKTVLVKLGTGK
jgi:hypothetical protein